MCAIIESAQSSFCTMRMDWKVAVLKIQLACLCFTDGSAFAGKPEPHQWSSVFIHSIAEYWALHSVYWEVTVWLATFFFLCRIYVHWHHIVSKTQMSHALRKPVPRNFLFFSFCTVDNKIIFPATGLLHDNVCKHWSNHNI